LCPGRVRACWSDVYAKERIDERCRRAALWHLTIWQPQMRSSPNPLVVLLGQDGPDEPEHGLRIGENPHAAVWAGVPGCQPGQCHYSGEA
jgi:hypothetical protein